jgi:hypothetical protein
MISSTSRSKTYQSTEAGVVADNGDVYVSHGEYTKKGDKTYYWSNHPDFERKKPLHGFLVGSYFVCIAEAPDHVEYYVSGSKKTIESLLLLSASLGHEVSYPDNQVVASGWLREHPVISFRFSMGELVETSIYITDPPEPVFLSSAPLELATIEPVTAKTLEVFE